MAKILLVDDCKNNRELAMRILNREHDVEAVSDWSLLLPHIAQGDVDLVLMDVKMPGLKGDKLTSMLRTNMPNIQLKIVLFSAMDLLELKKMAQNSGADGYIVKTFNKTLLELVANFL